MSKSREELRKFVVEAVRLLPRRRRILPYQRAVLWILFLGGLILVLDVVFFR
jgi:cell division septal protein FtsQ